MTTILDRIVETKRKGIAAVLRVLTNEGWVRAVRGPLQMVRHERVDSGYSSAGSMVTVTPVEVNCSR